MKLRTFSQLVLDGMRKSGFSDDKIASILHERPAIITQLNAGRRALSFHHEDLIESVTKLSSAQFAMRILDPKGSSELSKIINDMTPGSFQTKAAKPARATTRRPSHRSLKLA